MSFSLGSVVNRNVYVYFNFTRVTNRCIVFQVYNFCAVHMGVLPCFPRYLTVLSEDEMYAYFIVYTTYISLAIWIINAL